MIKKFELTGVHVDIDPKLKKYVSKKLRHLDYYVHRNARASIHAEVILKEVTSKDKNRHSCEVIMHLPHETITVTERTVNMYAAIDIVEAKLKNRLKKYKELHAGPRLHRRLLARFKRTRPATEA